MAWTYNTKVIREGRSWVDDSGVAHPTNCSVWTDDEKESAGLVWQEDPAPYDPRYFYSAGNMKALEDIIEQEIGKARSQVYNALSKTDWMVIRKTETGTDIPESITEYRQDLRTYMTAVENAASAIQDSDVVVGNMNLPVFPEDPETMEDSA